MSSESEQFRSNCIGYFGPDTITWQLYREPAILLGGVRALILQIAHPAVADGVARFSNFQHDPLGRGYRTFVSMATIYFGTKAQAEKTAHHLWHIHSGIRGHYHHATGGTPTAHAYSANDPDLLFWVLATLVETTISVYEKVPLPDLPSNWKAQFFEESKIAARLLGIPEEIYPADLQAFRFYFETILNGDLLGSASVCRDMAQAIVRHPRAPKKWANLFAAGWLPAPLCQRLGIEAGEYPELRLETWLRRFGRLYRLIPGALRYNPAYHQAKYRIAKAEGKPPSLAGCFFAWLGKRMKVPLGLAVHRNDIAA